uniref:Uncharacterized protein n=1 Tax=Timema poppense TaxID=170557 RepID=A0A7R9GXI3_TIMPO|nr:unnamed protein product [Timema poppensis]
MEDLGFIDLSIPLFSNNQRLSYPSLMPGAVHVHADPNKLNVYKNDTDSWDYTTPAIGTICALNNPLKNKEKGLRLANIDESSRRGPPKIPRAALGRGLARLRAHLPKLAARNTLRRDSANKTRLLKSDVYWRVFCRMPLIAEAKL